MWKRFWQFLFVQIGILPQPSYLPPCSLELAMKNATQNPESSKVITTVEPSLYEALVLARQEALDPVLPEHLKSAVESTVKKVLPKLFKDSLLKKEDLILISSTDVGSILDPTYSSEEWHLIKLFVVKELINNGINAHISNTAEFIQCHVQQILSTIKDYKIPEKEVPTMNSIGVYR